MIMKTQRVRCRVGCSVALTCCLVALLSPVATGMRQEQNPHNVSDDPDAWLKWEVEARKKESIRRRLVDNPFNRLKTNLGLEYGDKLNSSEIRDKADQKIRKVIEKSSGNAYKKYLDDYVDYYLNEKNDYLEKLKRLTCNDSEYKVQKDKLQRELRKLEGKIDKLKEQEDVDRANKRSNQEKACFGGLLSVPITIGAVLTGFGAETDAAGELANGALLVPGIALLVVGVILLAYCAKVGITGKWCCNSRVPF